MSCAIAETCPRGKMGALTITIKGKREQKIRQKYNSTFSTIVTAKFVTEYYQQKYAHGQRLIGTESKMSSITTAFH